MFRPMIGPIGKRQRIWAVLAAVAAANTLSATVMSPRSGVFRHVYTLHRDARVTIQNFYGNVTITAWDRDAVLVEAVKHSSDPRHLDDARIVVEPTADSLAIHTQYTGSDAEHPTSVEYRITVPRRIHLDNVTITNGQLSLDGLAGPIKASAVNGDIHALKLGGQADLSTINGRVQANFNRTSPANSISLSSINGAIDLTIPSGSGASLEAQNRSGGIATDMGRASRTEAGHRLIVRGTGPHIRLHNVNGGISIRSNERPCT
jgi:DUF4097 and DUF4098 domain-containing protein YvlB